MDSIHLPNAITLPTTFGAPGTPLPPGQVVQALVLELIESDVFRLQLPQATVDVRSDVPLSRAARSRSPSKGSGRQHAAGDLRRRRQPAAPAPGASTMPPSLAGKHPIGEAVIIARAPVRAGQGPEVRQAASSRPSSAMRRSRAPGRGYAPAARRHARTGARRSGARRRQRGKAALRRCSPMSSRSCTRRRAVAGAGARRGGRCSALRVPLDEQFTAADVKQAFVRSGVLFEPRLAAAKGARLRRQLRRSHCACAGRRPQGRAAGVSSGARRSGPRASRRRPLPCRPSITGRTVQPRRGDAAPGAAPPDACEHQASRECARGRAGRTDAYRARRSRPSRRRPSPKPSRPRWPRATRRPHAARRNRSGPPPPYRGAPLAAQQPAAPSIAPDTPPHETAERLLAADRRRARAQTLLQAASLPDQPTASAADRRTQRWTFEVPFATPQGTAIAQFEVSRDGRTAQVRPAGARSGARASRSMSSRWGRCMR